MIAFEQTLDDRLIALPYSGAELAIQDVLHGSNINDTDLAFFLFHDYAAKTGTPLNGSMAQKAAFFGTAKVEKKTPIYEQDRYGLTAITSISRVISSIENSGISDPRQKVITALGAMVREFGGSISLNVTYAATTDTFSY